MFVTTLCGLYSGADNTQENTVLRTRNVFSLYSENYCIPLTLKALN